MNNLRRWLVPCLLVLVAALPARAQEGKIDIARLDRLEKSAIETIDVTLGESLIKLAASFLRAERSPDEKLAKELINDLKGVYVKRFVFEKDSQYTDSDVEQIRSQLKAPDWERIVGVRTKRQGANVDVHIMTHESVIKGLAVLVAEPKALTVVNVVGPIDLEKLSQLEGKFGIPKLDLEQVGKPKADKQPGKQPDGQ
jgi:hypothetical protein